MVMGSVRSFFIAASGLEVTLKLLLISTIFEEKLKTFLGLGFSFGF